MSFTIIELFAGAGGLALGLEKAGLKGTCFVEFDKSACQTLKRNRPNWNVICDDVHKVDFRVARGNVDVVSGGAPCQAFSYAGKKLGFEDTRGTLFHEFARCVMEVNPKMFLFENVRGLLSHDKGRTFETISSVFKSLNYEIQYQVLNACYYGVGQKRERIIVIGIRKDLTDKIHFEYPKPDETWTTVREALRDCPDSIGEEYSERKRKVMDLVPPGGCWIDLPENVAKNILTKRESPKSYDTLAIPKHRVTKKRIAEFRETLEAELRRLWSDAGWNNVESYVSDFCTEETDTEIAKMIARGTDPKSYAKCIQEYC